MHIHTTQATAAGNAMAGAQAAETAIAMRRARELREKADKIKALSSGSDADFAPNFAADPQVTSMLGGWAAAAQPLIQPPEAPRHAPSDAPLDLSAELFDESIAAPVSQLIFDDVVPRPATRPATDPVSFWA